MSRIGIFGWGVVAPRSPDVDAFAARLESSESWLEPFDGFGPDSFLVGRPSFDLARYRPWIEERFPPNRFSQLIDKTDLPSHYALGAFIQALGQNPGLEEELQRLGDQAHVYVGSGIGNVGTIACATRELDRAQARWDRFWADPVRNPAHAAWLHGAAAGAAGDPSVPRPPEEVAETERAEAEAAWHGYWAGRSEALRDYLRELADIESLSIEGGDVETGKMRVMKEKRRRISRLEARWDAPTPPWAAVSANVIWNLHNTPSSQITMLGRITGLSFAPVAACSTFGVSLKLAIDAIRRGEAKAVVVGATDPPPHPLIVAAFYRGRVIAADAAVSKPLDRLRGTHVAGGACVWILGDLDHLRACGFSPLGMETLAVGVSSDADHIITPSREGPTRAILQALAAAGIAPDEIASWDLHATATPGDFQEVSTLRSILPASVLVTARKGTFGHGMAAGGGWELTAQYLGYARGRLFPTPLTRDELSPAIASVHERFVFERPAAAPAGPVGKLSMGIGGVNACVVSRPWEV